MVLGSKDTPPQSVAACEGGGAPERKLGRELRACTGLGGIPELPGMGGNSKFPESLRQLKKIRLAQTAQLRPGQEYPIACSRQDFLRGWGEVASPAGVMGTCRQD